MNNLVQRAWQRNLSIGLVLVGCLLRLLSLDADPDYYIWVGYIIDEGRWVENARRMLLFDEPLAPSVNIHLVVAPLFQGVSLLLFTVFDIGRWTARLIPAITGSALLVVVWLCLRSRVNGVALVLVTALLATQEDLVMLSRMCIPEMPAMLLETAAFLVLLSVRGLNGALFAGILTVCALGMKATAAPVVPVFGLVAWVTGGPARRDRVRRLAVFLGPFALAMVIGIAAGLLLDLKVDYRVFGRFLHFKDPWASFNFLRANPMGPTFYLWLLPAWGALVAMLCSPLRVHQQSFEWFRASAIWASSYFLLALFAGYFPARYLAHMLVPLAILAGVSVHILLQVRLAAGWVGLGGISLIRRFSIGLIVALPAAVFLAAAFWPFFGALDPMFQRARWQIASVLMLWAIGAFFFGVRRPPRIDFAVPFVFACAATWLLGHRLYGWAFWTPAEAVPSGVQWVPLIGLGVAGAFRAFARKREMGGPIVVVVALVFAAVSIAPFLPSILAPQFTLRDTSRDLELVLKDETEIVSYETEGLFIDNDLPYESHFRASWVHEPPRVVVRFDFPWRRIRFPLDSYEPVKTYDLYISPRYPHAPARVVVYYRRAAGE